MYMIVAKTQWQQPVKICSDVYANYTCNPPFKHYKYKIVLSYVGIFIIVYLRS